MENGQKKHRSDEARSQKEKQVFKKDYEQVWEIFNSQQSEKKKMLMVYG